MPMVSLANAAGNFLASTPAPNRQQFPNSCWACATRHIANFFQGAHTYVNDQALVLAVNGMVMPINNPAVDAPPVIFDVQDMASAAEALHRLGHNNNADDQAIPTPQEIADQINAGNPLIANVGNVRGRDVNFVGGHWVVIVGVNDATRPPRLEVFDPDTGVIENVQYDQNICYLGAGGGAVPNLFWKSTSYVDP
jgi:hypothetical protein